jgi:hypothetical protein
LQGREFKQIIEFAIPPFVVFMLLEALIPFPAYPPVRFPSLLILGLLCLLSVFTLGDGESDGYFSQPATNWEKGIRLVSVKFMEMFAEFGAYHIFKRYDISEPFFSSSHSLEKNAMTAVAMLLFSCLAIAALRTFLIFPWIVLSMRWAYEIPLTWYVQEPHKIL